MKKSEQGTDQHILIIAQNEIKSQSILYARLLTNDENKFRAAGRN